MDFEWDERKRRQVLEDRGVDLLEAAVIFDGWTFTEAIKRHDDGEVRERVVGMVGDQCYVVAFTRRGDALRLITAWKGGRRKRSEYQARLARRDPGDEGAG